MKEKMFKKVLFPTDFSTVSMKALEYVKELKELGTEEIILLNVIKDEYYYDSSLIEGPKELAETESRVPWGSLHGIKLNGNAGV